MARASLRQTIIEYCNSHGIVIPAGFARHSASRYAIVRTDLNPPKLMALTWFKQVDVIYYLEHVLLAEISNEAQFQIQILDFHSSKRYLFVPSKGLVDNGRF
jgi:hypothetical protein